jgi:hypothetical protein
VSGRRLARLDERLRRLTPPRVGPFRPGAFRGRLHAERTAAWLGIALGVAFGLCFVTGLLSHLIQYPVSWFSWPARPAWLYRVTQGVHVATGIVAIPLLLAKLWTVSPRFWAWPPFRGVAHLLERITLVPLVGGSLFLLFTGIASISRLRPWTFSFPAAHYAAAWVAMGGLVAHVGAKLHVAARALRREAAAEPAAEPATGLSRRGFLGAAAAAAGAVTLATVGADGAAVACDLGARAPGPRGRSTGRAGEPHGAVGRRAGARDRPRLPPDGRGRGGDPPHVHAR